jgi:hypothetical protein
MQKNQKKQEYKKDVIKKSNKINNVGIIIFTKFAKLQKKVLIF